MVHLVRRLVIYGALLLVLSACGEQGLLDDLGERSHEYVEGSTTTTLFTSVTAPVTTPPGVVAATTASWFNVGLDGEESSPESAVVLATVWRRGRDTGRFIQASPYEIWTSLPGLEFPAVVPEEAGWITSQLVFDAASATLDIDTSAAFGLWSAEPYSTDEGRLAVLRVGQAANVAEVGGGIVASPVEEGLSLQWSGGGFKYELFCIAQIPEDMCWQMVESARPLDSVAPTIVVVGENGTTG